jgi:hypothetical protein
MIPPDLVVVGIMPIIRAKGWIGNQKRKGERKLSYAIQDACKILDLSNQCQKSILEDWAVKYRLQRQPHRCICTLASSNV